MNIDKWLKMNSESLKGKRVVITGATGGLGREICFMLARLEADITLACRNEKLAENLKSEILYKYPNIKIDFVELDLSNIKSVKNCINILKLYKGIDIFINNAGVYNVPLKKLDSGFNNIFQINFVYTYYLTKMLLPELKKKKDSLCITVGSIAHKFAKLDENDIDYSEKKKQSKIYGNSKRFLMFSLNKLFENSDVRLAIVHPGVTLTNMTNHYPKAINWLVKIGIKILFPSPQKAARNIIYAISHHTKSNEWIGPSIFNIWGKPKVSKLTSCNTCENNKIFQLAESLYENLVETSNLTK